MKKTSFLISVFFLLFLFSAKAVLADCYTTPAVGATIFGVGGSLSVPCPGSSDRCTQTLCCDTATECQEQKDQEAGGSGGSSGSGPTGGVCANDEINTAIGCIPFGDTNAFMGFILKWAIGVGGGIAFLLIIFAGFQIMTSSGNPEKLKAGQELLTSAIAGLIMLIFSVFILRVIGVDILQIPGFSN